MTPPGPRGDRTRVAVTKGTRTAPVRTALRRPEQKHPWHGPWNLERLDERLHAIAGALEVRQFDEAIQRAKEAKKTARKGKWPSDLRKRVKFLDQIAREVGGAAKLVDKKRVSFKDLDAVTTLTTRYRDTGFAYLLCLDIQDEIRERKSVSVIADFEPEKMSYGNLRTPFDFFKKWRPNLRGGVGPNSTSEFRHVRQGRYARHIKVRVGKEVYLTFPVLESNWSDLEYICFSAKMKEPTLGSIGIRMYGDRGRENYWDLGCGYFKGWRDFRFRFKKEAGRTKRNAKLSMSWSEIHGVRFNFWGGDNEFWLDNVYVCE